MILSLFTFYITFIDYHGHSIEAKVSFPRIRGWGSASHIFLGEFSNYNGLAKLDVMTGNIMINDQDYGSWTPLNSTFFVTEIAIRNSTPFKLSEIVVSRLFDYVMPIQYEDEKYVFERRFWSWDDVKTSWSNFLTLILQLNY